ncbi:MAG TPA: type VI secretion system tube protein Hcp [Cellvibrio sp.]|nr:type VI secretion system tube protein Hcp [Cellvibrio sp.]
MAIYIEYQGIKGNVTAEGYKNHLSVESLQFGVGRGISMEPGKLANREATRPSISEITVSKVADSSTTAFFKEAVGGSAGKEVTIKFVQTGSDKLVEYMAYTLEDCLVSGYSISASSSGDPIESISLSFAKITLVYNDFDKTNKTSTPNRAGYDLTVAKAL